MSDTTDLRKAITCLYIAADKSVADDVKTHAEAVIGEVKYLRDEQSKSAAAYGYAIKEIERLREENRRLVEELDEAEARAVRVGIKRR